MKSESDIEHKIQLEINERDSGRMLRIVGVLLALYNFLLFASAYEKYAGMPTLSILVNYRSWVYLSVDLIFLVLIVLSPSVAGKAVGLSHKHYNIFVYLTLTVLFAVFSAVSIADVGRLNMAVVVIHGLMSALIVLHLRVLVRILVCGLIVFLLVYLSRLLLLDLELKLYFVRYILCLALAYMVARLLAKEHLRYLTLRKRLIGNNLELKDRELQLKQLNRQLEQLALVDKLTGLNNRHAFDDVFEREWARAKRSGQAMGLLMLDVDHFKLLNDTQGHPQGDHALSLLGKLINQQIRRSTDFTARFGGEEFVVLLPDTNLEGSLVVANRVIVAVRKLAFKHPSSTGEYLTLSIGCHVAYPKTNSESKDLLSTADQALYQAKHNGRNRVACLST